MERGKIGALTGIRFVAAAMILVHHSQPLRIPVPPYAFDHGVSLFFVLSGFILAYAYPRLDDWASIKTFLILRLARIWPAHAFTLVLAASALAMPVVNLKFLANLMMVQAWVPSAPWYFSFNAPSWSISTECFFYLAFPLLIWQWRKTWWWKWLASAGLVVALGVIGKKAGLPDYSPENAVTLHGLLFVNPLARLFEFVTGMVAYSCFAALRPRAAGMGEVAGSVIELIVVAITVCFIIYNLTIRYAFQYFDMDVLQNWLVHTGSVVIFPFLIVSLALGRGVISRLLSSGIAVLLGEISYSVYLVHMIVFGVYIRYWMAPGTEPDYVGFGLCIVVTLVLAFLIWKFIEAPVRNAVKKRVRRKASKQPLTVKPTWDAPAA